MIRIGKFTQYNEKWIDEQIQSQLDKIIEVIKDTANKDNINVKSIILSGGFGRGEGSLIVYDKKAIPLKDYDILVIVDKKPRKNVVKTVQEMIYQKLKMASPEKRDFRFSDFVIDVRFATEEWLLQNPDIAIYELKNASYLLWGDDIRKKIPWTKKDIPISSPMRFLFEKMTGLIGHFSEGYLNNEKINRKENLLIIYECCKTYVEICTALCFLMGNYEPYYHRRRDIFSKNFKTKFPELYEKMPHLSEMVIRCTNFKLKPKFEEIEERTIDLWFKTRDDLITTLKYYLEKTLNIKIEDWGNSYEDICRRMENLFRWRGKILLNRIGIHNRHLNIAAEFFIRVGLNWKYSITFFKRYKVFPKKQLFRPCSPIISIFLISPLILLSLNKDGSINQQYFDKAKKYLHDVSVLNQNDEISWNELRHSYLKAYNLYCEISG